MDYLSVTQTAAKWNMSVRSVRYYCAEGKIDGVFLTGKTYIIPSNAVKPAKAEVKPNETGSKPKPKKAQKSEKKAVSVESQNKTAKTSIANVAEESENQAENASAKQAAASISEDFVETYTENAAAENTQKAVKIRVTTLDEKVTNNKLLNELKVELSGGTLYGVYGRTQTELVYDSLKLDGLEIERERVEELFVSFASGKTEYGKAEELLCLGAFQCVEYVISSVKEPFTKAYVEKLFSLYCGPNHAFATLAYKAAYAQLFEKYNAKKVHIFEDIVALQHDFIRLSPYGGAEGMLASLIVLKECLRSNIVPFIIDEGLQNYYVRGLKEWQSDRGALIDTCLAAQDSYKEIMREYGL